MSQFMVGRQPVFGASLDVRGYELLFRDPATPRPDGDVMTADVLVHAGLDLGLTNLVGAKLAFIKVTRPFLVGEYAFPFPARQSVIEIGQDVGRGPEVVAGCRLLAQNGYRLALEHYVWDNDHDPLLDLVSIIKLDVSALTAAQLADAVRRNSAFGVELMAEKVETRQQLTTCQDLGFNLYQGYLLGHPEVVEGHAFAPNRQTGLRIIERLFDPGSRAAEIEDIVKSDPALCYRLLKAAGAGANRGPFQRLSSIGDAIVLLGQRRLRSWVTLMLVADSHDSTDEPLRTALTRARMAELMASALVPGLGGPAYTVGLLSALDQVLAAPRWKIVEGLSLTGEVEDALLGQPGLLGDVLADVVAWHLGGENVDLRSHTSPKDAERFYQQALA
jgi:EAL and modified HD-GYP domain-containing signal transduction protein